MSKRDTESMVEAGARAKLATPMHRVEMGAPFDVGSAYDDDI